MHDTHIMILKENSIKVTPQRLTILNLLEQYGHLSIKELFSKIRPNFPSISLATIYKNINFLMEKSLLKEVKLSDLEARYEITKAPHAHLLCKKCGKIQDVAFDIDSMVKEFEKNCDFVIESNSIELAGICKDCQ